MANASGLAVYYIGFLSFGYFVRYCYMLHVEAAPPGTDLSVMSFLCSFCNIE